MSISKFPPYLLTGVLLVGVLLVLGFLSFAGMLALYNLIPLAIIAFFLAGLIEGQVYFQNILKSVKKLFGDGLEKEASQQMLNKLLKSNKDEHRKNQIENSTFLEACRALQQAIEELEKRASFDEDAKKILHQKQRELKWRQQYFHAWIMGEIDDNNGPLSNIQLAGTDENLNTKQAFQEKMQSKKWLFRFCLFASFISGIGCGFVFLHVAQESILVFASHFGIVFAGAALPLLATTLIYGVAVVSGLGYMLLVYNALTQTVQENTPQKWWRKIIKFFKRKQKKNGTEETDFQFIKRVGIGTLVVSLIVVLTIFATVTSTGTWWLDAMANAGLLIPYIGGPAAVALIGITIIITGLTTLNFNLFNVLRVVKKLSEIISWKNIKHAVKNFRNNIGKKVSEYIEKENIFQLLNPFRLIVTIINVPFKIVVFIGHIISTGLIGDRFDKVPVWASAAAGTFVDGLVDGGIVFSDVLDHAETHDHQKHSQQANEEVSQNDSIPKETLSSTDTYQKTSHYHKPHDHTHGDIPGGFLHVIFTITGIYFLSALWDFGFSHLPIKDGNSLTFKEAWQKTWHGIEVLSTTPEIKLEKNETVQDTSWRDVYAYKLEKKAKQFSENDLSIKANLLISLRDKTQVFSFNTIQNSLDEASPELKNFIQKLERP